MAVFHPRGMFWSCFSKSFQHPANHSSLGLWTWEGVVGGAGVLLFWFFAIQGVSTISRMEGPSLQVRSLKSGIGEGIPPLRAHHGGQIRGDPMYSTCLGCTWESMHHASWLRCIIEFAEVQTSPRQTSHSFGPRERHGVQVQSTSFSARPSLSRSRGDPAEPQPEPGHSSTCACLQESEPLLVFEGVNCQETKPFSRRLQSNTKQVEPPVAAFLFFRDILICLCSLWVCLLS